MSKQQITVTHLLILLFFICQYPWSVSPSSSSQTLLNLAHNKTGRFLIFAALEMKCDKIEFLWSSYLTPRFSFLQPPFSRTCNVGPSCEPRRHLTPSAWSQRLQYHKEQAMFWDLRTSFLHGLLLNFPTCSLTFSFSGGRGGALLLVPAVSPCPSSHNSASWENKVLSWKRDRCCWQLMQLRQDLVLQNQAEVYTGLPTLHTSKLNVSNLKLHTGVLL